MEGDTIFEDRVDSLSEPPLFKPYARSNEGNVSVVPMKAESYPYMAEACQRPRQ